jgi:hypothetical protein
MGPRFAFAALIIAFGIAITFATLKPALAHRAARSDRQPRAEYGGSSRHQPRPVRPGGSFAQRFVRRPQEEGDVGIPKYEVGRVDRSGERRIFEPPPKQRAFDYLDRGELRNAVASFINNMNARPDCELPHHLAALGVLLLMRNDALGWKALIEQFG